MLNFSMRHILLYLKTVLAPKNGHLAFRGCHTKMPAEAGFFASRRQRSPATVFNKTSSTTCIKVQSRLAPAFVWMLQLASLIDT